jgi:predicted membrane-bound spermidine synthase
LVFVVGCASLGAEIAAARLLAPYFGASTIIWANTIATVLVSLSVGYWFGGRLADRSPDRAGLCRLVLAAAVLLGAVPFVSGPFLRASVHAFDSVSMGAFLGSLACVLALVSMPVLLLGAASPYAVRLSLRRVEESGRVAGRLYAISTAGSLVGTFLSALALIPLVGTRRTFLVFAVALALVAALGLRRRYALAALALGALLALPAGTIKPGRLLPGDRVIAEQETPYQYVRVVRSIDGTRRLELNEGLGVHSVYRPGRFLTGHYWDDFLVLPWALRSRAPSTIAILGNAAGTTAREYGHFFPATAIDGVEIDGALSALGRRLFDERAPRLRLITADARPFLRAAKRRYDAIVVDAYRGFEIPFYLTTREFFALARARLAPGGVLMVNVGLPDGSQDLERVLAATIRAAGFPTLLRDPVDPKNTLLVGSDATPSNLRSAAPLLPAALRPLASTIARRLGPAPAGGAVYTDDRAPVESLIDSSIVRYAAGQR